MQTQFSRELDCGVLLDVLEDERRLLNHSCVYGRKVKRFWFAERRTEG